MQGSVVFDHNVFGKVSDIEWMKKKLPIDRSEMLNSFTATSLLTAFHALLKSDFVDLC